MSEWTNAQEVVFSTTMSALNRWQMIPEAFELSQFLKPASPCSGKQASDPQVKEFITKARAAMASDECLTLIENVREWATTKGLDKDDMLFKCLDALVELEIVGPAKQTQSQPLSWAERNGHPEGGFGGPSDVELHSR